MLTYMFMYPFHKFALLKQFLSFNISDVDVQRHDDWTSSYSTYVHQGQFLLLMWFFGNFDQ